MVKTKKGCSYAQKWLEKMKDHPCYAPCPPFYDVCNHAFQEGVKRFDCKECFEKRGMVDYIE